MSKWKHRLKDGVCVACNILAKVYNGKERCPVGKGTWGGRRHRYRYTLKIEKKICVACGFIPKHVCQLDIDHIDENKNNNNTENLQVLCANCHRIKTYNARIKVTV